MADGTMKKYIGYLRGKKQIWVIALGAFLGVLLILLGGSGKEDEQITVSGEGVGEEESLMSYTEYIEAKIKKLCESVDGVSDVCVAVTLEGGFERVYANDGEYVVIGSGNNKTPVLIKENLPEVRGVGIVCTGGGDASVRMEISSLLCAALDIPSNRIYIANGKE